MNAFSAMLADLYADPNIGTPALYTPPGGGSPIACNAVSLASDPEINIGDGRAFTHARTIDVLGLQVTPVRGGTFTLLADDGVTVTETVTIQGDPKRTDSDKRVWTCTVS